MTLSGVYATFYFLYNTAQMPTNPTSGAASRALGKSFGPICFGSIIVAIVHTLRALANQAKNDRDNKGFVQILACFAACILCIPFPLSLSFSVLNRKIVTKRSKKL